MSTVLNKFCRVKPEEKVTFRLSIGYAQVGSSDIYLDAESLASARKGSFEMELPYPGRELAGRTLFCTTVVADIRSETDMTSVTYGLTGGMDPLKQTLEEGVASEGDVLFYTLTVRFLA